MNKELQHKTPLVPLCDSIEDQLEETLQILQESIFDKRIPLSADIFEMLKKYEYTFESNPVLKQKFIDAWKIIMREILEKNIESMKLWKYSDEQKISIEQIEEVIILYNTYKNFYPDANISNIAQKILYLKKLLLIKRFIEKINESANEILLARFSEEKQEIKQNLLEESQRILEWISDIDESLWSFRLWVKEALRRIL